MFAKRGDREGPAPLLQKDNLVDPILPPSDDKNFSEVSISHWPTEVPFETTVRAEDSGLEEGAGQKVGEEDQKAGEEDHQLNDDRADVETGDRNVTVDDDSDLDLIVPDLVDGRAGGPGRASRPATEAEAGDEAECSHRCQTSRWNSRVFCHDCCCAYACAAGAQEVRASSVGERQGGAAGDLVEKRVEASDT